MTFDELIEIYRLTYFYQMLRLYEDRLGGWLPDRANMEMLKVQDRLFDMLNDGLEKMIRVYDMWLDHHYEMAVQEIAEDEIRIAFGSLDGASRFYENIGDYENGIDDLSESLESMGSERIGEEEKNKVLSDIEDELKEGNTDAARDLFLEFMWEVQEFVDPHEFADMLLEKDSEYKSIAEHKDKLEEAFYSNDLDDMIVQFHIGLTIAHHNGLMVEYLLRYSPAETPYPNVRTFLDDLSSGVTAIRKDMPEGFTDIDINLVKKWDRQLAKIIGKQYDPEEGDSQFIDWSERGRIRNPEAIPAPVDHIFIRE